MTSVDPAVPSKKINPAFPLQHPVNRAKPCDLDPASAVIKSETTSEFEALPIKQEPAANEQEEMTPKHHADTNNTDTGPVDNEYLSDTGAPLVINTDSTTSTTLESTTITITPSPSSSTGTDTTFAFSDVSSDSTNATTGGVPAAPPTAVPVVVSEPGGMSTAAPPPPPAAPPTRRRPGRPPGSTKKAKQAAEQEQRRSSGPRSPTSEFSLRRFFEAGGRDYADYIELYNQRQRMGQQHQRIPTPPHMPPPPPYTGTGSVMTPQHPHHPHHHQQQQQQQQLQPHQLARHMQQQQAYVPVSVPVPAYEPPPPYTQAVATHTIKMENSPPSSSFLQVQQQPPQMSHHQAYQTSHNVPVTVQPRSKAAPLRQRAAAAGQAVLLHRGSTVEPPEQQMSALDLSAKKRKSDEFTTEFVVGEESRKVTKYNYTDMTNSMVQSAHPGARYTSSPATGEVHNKRDSVSSNVSEPEVPESSTDGAVSTWDVDQVVRFIMSVPGCAEYAEVFREQRVDGASLPHLSEQHLLNVVQMKLGPAIRLRLEISKLFPAI